MVLDDYDEANDTGDECDLNFLTFVLQLTKKPGKNLTKKLIRPGMEPGPAD